MREPPVSGPATDLSIFLDITPVVTYGNKQMDRVCGPFLRLLPYGIAAGNSFPRYISQFLRNNIRIKIGPTIITAALGVAVFRVYGEIMNNGIAVFIDFENMRRVGASRFASDFSPEEAIICPSLVADLVAGRRPTATPVTSITVVRGEPNRFRDPHAASRFGRDADRWARDPRIRKRLLPLHYRPYGAPKESGVDLRLGLDFVAAARSKRYEAVVLLTGDSDFRPALDDAAGSGTRVELAFWATGMKRADSPLAHYAVTQKHLWTHRLTEDDFWDCVPEQWAAA